MPDGVIYKKPKGVDLSEQIDAMQQILQQQLESIEARELDTQRYIFSNGRIQQNLFDDSPYLITMIKGVESPSQQQYAIINVLKDFNLILTPGKVYDLALTEVAIAIQFEKPNFNYMQILIGQVVIEYLQSRIRYLKELNSIDLGHFDKMFQYYELNPKFTRQDFQETNIQAIQSCKNFIQGKLPYGIKLEKTLDLYVGATLQESFQLKEIIKILTLVLLEKQVCFNSQQRDKISKVMFGVKMLLPDDFPWQNFFIPIKPAILFEGNSLPVLAGNTSQGQYSVEIDSGTIVGEKIAVPSFLQELKYSKFSDLGEDLKQKLYDYGVMKSQLWIDIVHRRQLNYNRGDKTLMIQQEILDFYDKTQFQRVAKKIPTHYDSIDEIKDTDYQMAFKDYQFMKTFVKTQAFVQFIKVNL